MEVQCFLCKEKLFFCDAFQISIIPPVERDEIQYFFCHKECLNKILPKDIPMHPSLIDN